MLPNHSPLVIAEQFGTLESLYPGRIDLGLGRAPGTDQLTVRALRRDLTAPPSSFPEDVVELRATSARCSRASTIRAVPGAGLNVPLWILGSSLYGAQVAAHFGLPYAFASHFAPDALDDALARLPRALPAVGAAGAPVRDAGVNVFAADTDAEARRLFTSLQQRFIDMVRNARGRCRRRSTTSRPTGRPPRRRTLLRMLVVLVRRLARHDPAQAERVHRTDRRRRADDQRRGVRPGARDCARSRSWRHSTLTHPRRRPAHESHPLLAFRTCPRSRRARRCARSR